LRISLRSIIAQTKLQSDEDVALESNCSYGTRKGCAVDSALVIEAAVYGLRYKLPLADSIIYATAKKVWGCDMDSGGRFQDLNILRR
jgi:hypothetical protein